MDATARNGDVWTGEHEGDWWTYRDSKGLLYESKEIPAYRIDMNNARLVTCEDGKTAIGTIQNMKSNNPRFVWLIGAIKELYPDVPEPRDSGEIVLWDRQCKREVAIVRPEYAQAICLEVARPGLQPFTDLENWFNKRSDAALESEGIEPTKKEYKL